MRIPYPKKQVNNIINKESTLTGKIHSNDDWVILGNYKGVLQTEGNVYIDAAATIEGDVLGNHIWIAGSIVGNIYATNGLNILASSCIRGNIHYGKLSMEEGAYLSGKSIAESHSHLETRPQVMDWDRNQTALPRF